MSLVKDVAIAALMIIATMLTVCLLVQTNERAAVESALVSVTQERDEALVAREACANRAEMYRQASLSFSNEVTKYLGNRFYSMNVTESLALIQLGKTEKCEVAE